MDEHQTLGMDAMVSDQALDELTRITEASQHDMQNEIFSAHDSYTIEYEYMVA